MSARIAVVIPLYNHEAYIGTAIESVLAQSRPPDRICIVDDGSTDGSLAAARAFDDPRIQIETGRNRGAHRALRRGIEMAEDCDHVAILNSDDFFTRDRLARCATHLDLNPGVSLLCTRLRLVDAGGLDLPASEPRAKWFAAAWSLKGSGLSLAEWLGIANFAGTTSNFYARRAWLLEHPFGSYRYVHDYHALVQAAVRGELALVDDSLLAYRVHGSNTITTEPENLVREVLRMNLDLVRELLPEIQHSPAVRAAFLDYLRCAWGNISSFRADLFQVALARALDNLPPDAVFTLVETIDRKHFPEVAEYPNRALVNAHRGMAPLGPTSGLGEKYAALQRDLVRLKAERAALSLLGGALELAVRSRWLALGALFGTGSALLAGAEGGEPAARLQNLRERTAGSLWFRVGATFGSRNSRRLLQSLRETTST